MATFPAGRPSAWSLSARWTGRPEKEAQREKMPLRKDMNAMLVHHSLPTEDVRCHLWGLLQNGHVGPLVQRLLRIPRCRQQSIKPSVGPFSVQGPLLLYMSHAHDTSPVPTLTRCRIEACSAVCQSLAMFPFP